MMQAFTAPASFVFAQFFGKEILVSSIQDVLIPTEDGLHLILSWLSRVRIDHFWPTSERRSLNSIRVIA